MDYKLVYTDSAQRDLLRFEKQHAQLILKKMDYFMGLDNPLLKAKKLKNFEMDTYRFRVGDFRVVFRIDKKTENLVVLVVLKIANRKEIYRKN